MACLNNLGKYNVFTYQTSVSPSLLQNPWLNYEVTLHNHRVLR